MRTRQNAGLGSAAALPRSLDDAMTRKTAERWLKAQERFAQLTGVTESDDEEDTQHVQNQTKTIFKPPQGQTEVHIKSEPTLFKPPQQFVQGQTELQGCPVQINVNQNKSSVKESTSKPPQQWVKGETQSGDGTS